MQTPQTVTQVQFVCSDKEEVVNYYVDLCKYLWVEPQTGGESS